MKENRGAPGSRGNKNIQLRVVTKKAGGAEGIRTPDPHNAIVVLYQLSYDPSQTKGKI
jgi:hypothetical protein